MSRFNRQPHNPHVKSSFVYFIPIYQFSVPMAPNNCQVLYLLLRESNVVRLFPPPLRESWLFKSKYSNKTVTYT